LPVASASGMPWSAGQSRAQGIPPPWERDRCVMRVPDRVRVLGVRGTPARLRTRDMRSAWVPSLSEAFSPPPWQPPCTDFLLLVSRCRTGTTQLPTRTTHFSFAARTYAAVAGRHHGKEATRIVSEIRTLGYQRARDLAPSGKRFGAGLIGMTPCLPLLLTRRNGRLKPGTRCPGRFGQVARTICTHWLALGASTWQLRRRLPVVFRWSPADHASLAEQVEWTVRTHRTNPVAVPGRAGARVLHIRRRPCRLAP
jgi:hypothetical protein